MEVKMSDAVKAYDAILIDTSIFDGNGLRLEKGLLAKLSQFRKSPIELVFPDVIKNEVQSHLEKKIKVARSALEKTHLFVQNNFLRAVLYKYLYYILHYTFHRLISNTETRCAAL